jgi:hypothetical protein
MTFEPNLEFTDQEARNQLFALEEHILTQDHRIAFLETRIRQFHRTSEQFSNTKQQIAAHDTLIAQLIDDNLIRIREHQELTSKLASVTKFQEELKEHLIQRPLGFPRDSIESDLSQLKAAMIENSIFPDRSFLLKVDPFEGIISFLTRNCGGNVSDHGIVQIQSSSFLNETHSPKNSADFTPGSPIFESKNELNQWIEWNFKTFQIEPTHYSIQTHGGEPNSGHLRQWIIEGRNDKEKWIQLDERRDDSHLNGEGRIATFQITNPFRVQIIRLRQIGLNHRNDPVLAFAAFEIFGNLFRNRNTDSELIRLSSVESDFSQLRTELIENAILPERFVVSENGRFDGIIAHLTRDCDGNIVEVRASSFFNEECVPQNTVDFNWMSPIFASKAEVVNQWIEWDFKTFQIKPTYYSIRTHDGEKGDRHLKQWIIEGKNDEEKWIQLDERRDDSKLNGKAYVATFQITNPTRVRIIRLQQTGLNHRNDHMLAFNSFELFGDLFR